MSNCKFQPLSKQGTQNHNIRILYDSTIGLIVDTRFLVFKYFDTKLRPSSIEKLLIAELTNP